MNIYLGADTSSIDDERIGVQGLEDLKLRYGLDIEQTSRAIEFRLSETDIHAIEKRQIEGKIILEKIDQIPQYIKDILLEIHDSLEQNNLDHIKTLPKELYPDIKGIIENIFTKEVLQENYHIGACLYDKNGDMALENQGILFLLSLWQKFPKLFGRFYQKKDTSIDVIEYYCHPFLLSRVKGGGVYPGYYLNLSGVMPTQKQIKSFLRHSKINYNFSFVGSDNVPTPIAIRWLKESIVIGGLAVENDRLKTVSWRKYWKTFLSDFILNPPEGENSKIIIQEIFGQDIFQEIADEYKKLSDVNTVANPIKKSKKTKSKPKTLSRVVDKSEKSQEVQSVYVDFDKNSPFVLTLGVYTGPMYISLGGNDKEELQNINEKYDISSFFTSHGLSYTEDHALSIEIPSDRGFTLSHNTILWKSPILEYMRTSSPDLSGEQKYTFERGEIKPDFFSSIENTHKYNEYIGVEIISEKGIQISSNDLPLENGKYEFRYFLKSNPEIISKSTYYTRNIKASPQVVKTIESNVIQVMDTPKKPTQEIIHSSTSVSQAQQSFENTVIDALSDEQYTVHELSDSLYEIELAGKIIITYDREKGIFSLISDFDITLSGAIEELLRDDIIEPYFDTKEMIRKNEALEEKESQIKELKKIRNIYRRELESYDLKDVENPFNMRVEAMMRRDAGIIKGYLGYATIISTRRGDVEKLLEAIPRGLITIHTNPDTKELKVHFELGNFIAYIRSTKKVPYYDIVTQGFDDNTRDIEQICLDTIRYLYLLLGVMSIHQKKENIYTNREGKNMIIDAYKRIKKGEAKIELDSGWYHGGWHESKIEGKKGLDVLTGDDDIRIVLHDESIAVADKGPGQTDIYERIRDNERLQKYLILRMVATIRNKKFKNKSPFDHAMKDEFLKVWNSLGENDKKGFTDIFAHDEEGSTDIALIYEVDGENFLEKVLTSWEDSKVALVYRSPQIIGVDEFQEYIADMREKGELA